MSGLPLCNQHNRQLLDRFKADDYMLVNTLERDARNDGWKAGIAQGLAEGKSLGLAEGSHQKALETARILKQLGDSVQKIVQVTGLTIQEVEKLSAMELIQTRN